MAATSIEWTDHSVNPIRARAWATNKVGHHCEKVSPGCANCYASALQKRFGLTEFAGPSRRETVQHFLDESKLQEVLRRKKPTKYFWADMTDLFGAWVPDDWLDRCFATMALTPHHTHQVLTKRPERMRSYFDDEDTLTRIALAACELDGGRVSALRKVFARGYDEDGKMDEVYLEEIPRNVWLGVSIEDQQRANERIPLLLQVPAAVRFLSIEPLLGPIALDQRLIAPIKSTSQNGLRFIDWVIIGAESGRDARPCDVAWVRSLVRQCKEAGIACFVKQLGAKVVWSEADVWAGVSDRRLRDPKGGDPSEWSEDLRVREFPCPGEKGGL